MQISIRVKKKGPIFDGRAKAAMRDYLTDVREVIADHGVNDVHVALGGVLKHPTGYYQSRVTTNVQADSNVVTDGGVVYGPWLEGVGSRNASTRFKGYHTFRKVTQRLNAKATSIANNVLKQHLGRMQ